MITTLITIQTICVATSTIYLAKIRKSKRAKLKLHKEYSNGFKHYKVGGM